MKACTQDNMGYLFDQYLVTEFRERPEALYGRHVKSVDEFVTTGLFTQPTVGRLAGKAKPVV